MNNNIGMNFKNDLIFGSWINTGSPIVVEILAKTGFDYLVLDAEHSAISIDRVSSLLQAMKSGHSSCFPMVRVPGHEYSEIKRYLDAGALGIIAPLVNCKEDAQKIVDAVKYPPFGKRGVGFGRCHDYGFGFEEYMKSANENTFICVQIEHIDGVNNIDEIFSVNGINAAIIGPYDLTASMGITAKFDHPDYIDARNKILSKCIEHDIMPGIHVVFPRPEEVADRIAEGYKMIAYSLDTIMLGETARMGLEAIRNNKRNAL